MWKQSGRLSVCHRHQDWSLTWCSRSSASRKLCASDNDSPELAKTAFGGAFCDGVGFFTVNISLSSNTKNRESSKCEGQPQIRSEVCILLSTILVLSFSSRVVLCKSFLCLGSGAVDPRLCAVTPFSLFGSASCSFANTCNSVVFGDIITREVKGLFFI